MHFAIIFPLIQHAFPFHLVEHVELQLDPLHAAGDHGVHLGDLLALRDQLEEVDRLLDHHGALVLLGAVQLQLAAALAGGHPTGKCI